MIQKYFLHKSKIWESYVFVQISMLKLNIYPQNKLI